jgi:hypothetical protein
MLPARRAYSSERPEADFPPGRRRRPYGPEAAFVKCSFTRGYGVEVYLWRHLRLLMIRISGEVVNVIGFEWRECFSG